MPEYAEVAYSARREYVPGMARGTDAEDTARPPGARVRLTRGLEVLATAIAGLTGITLAAVFVAGLAIFGSSVGLEREIVEFPTQGARLELRELNIATANPSLTPKELPHSQPERLRIRAIQLDAPLKRVAADKEGLIAAPPLGAVPVAGWYQNSPSPGSAGTSLIVGRVRGPEGPALFYMLSALHTGNTIEIERRDGLVAVFSIYQIAVQQKEIPIRYSRPASASPELRLMTYKAEYNNAAGGSFGATTTIDARLLTVMTP
ncbi:class F sortase [Streptomyces sp. NPDC096030]|uniref:class F sortase n=1 Tax=Streptomyces sp. NPDC096030 TaxID=3155423 RepID=UPI003317676D